MTRIRRTGCISPCSAMRARRRGRPTMIRMCRKGSGCDGSYRTGFPMRSRKTSIGFHEMFARTSTSSRASGKRRSSSAAATRPARRDDRFGAGASLTIERRGRKGRKEIQCFSAAFAAFAFHGGVGYSDILLDLFRPGQVGDDLPVEPHEPVQLRFEDAFLIAVRAETFRAILHV